MKRWPPEKKSFHVYKTWPLFLWTGCWVCKMQFRREYGWKWAQAAGPEWVIWGHICNECAPTEDTAYEKITRIKEQRSP